MTTVCGCFCGSTPEPASVVVTNNTINLTMGAAAMSWVVQSYAKADSAGGLGLNFFLAFPAAIAAEVIVYIDNVAQEVGASYSVPASLDRVTLTSALDADATLIVRYLAYQDTTIWASQTLRVQDSTALSGLEFTLAYTPLADSTTFLFKDGAILTNVTDYSRSGVTITLVAALAAGEQLVVTYAH